MEGETIINKWHGLVLDVKDNNQDNFAVVGCSEAKDSPSQKWVLGAPIGYVCLINFQNQ